ncbi:DUF4124 domain-containing protein [Pseudoxanthomonas broegbernensis]|uniref:DUF4124 domain-containing protein n=1 Tax=Pseudoxanthomonas broegbernensis TaxID=83619 RepID=A0A7V8K7H7_9GAMM|nr:DUF4124 domain-containing protein [Pseudoxanthomonas broegbernensis]KAF1686596.1 DUF4124 domain-containing protein [Pseudoxanthomonas broegbernensis]MBB6063655.1 hypothetical protein [Pseudoxanthomonas broegbernensis]
MRILSRSCLLFLAAGLSTAALASNVYQWKDANGVTHSSDKPPPGQQYDVRRIDHHGQTAEAALPATSVETPQCVDARNNLKLLQGSVAVQQDTDGDGTPDHTLSADEREAQKGLAEAAVKAYCRG